MLDPGLWLKDPEELDKVACEVRGQGAVRDEVGDISRGKILLINPVSLVMQLRLVLEDKGSHWSVLDSGVAGAALCFRVFLLWRGLEGCKYGNHSGDCCTVWVLVVIMPRIIDTDQDWTHLHGFKSCPQHWLSLWCVKITYIFYYDSFFFLFHISASLKIECVCRLVSQIEGQFFVFPLSGESERRWGFWIKIRVTT